MNRDDLVWLVILVFFAGSNFALLLATGSLFSGLAFTLCSLASAWIFTQAWSKMQ